MRSFVLFVVLSVPAVGQVPADLLSPEETEAYKAAVAKGRAEAEAELKSCGASIWTYGHNPKLLFSRLDPETGLLFSSFGCVIDDELVGRVKGHNARIVEYIRDLGPPANSFKRWQKELFGLNEYFERRCRTEKPTPLIVGGKAVVSPDGKYTLRVVKVPGRTLEGKPTESTWFVIGEEDVESNRAPLLISDAELLWGPKGSWFAVLRGTCRMGDQKDYVAVDLRCVRTIRLEFGKDQPPQSRANTSKESDKKS
jgi:hypothetical protein